MAKYSLLVKFIDGEELTLHEVSDYTMDTEGMTFDVEKDGCITFIPVANVKYIGRMDNLRSEKSTEDMFSWNKTIDDEYKAHQKLVGTENEAKMSSGECAFTPLG